MSFASWKIRVAYLNSPIPKTLSYVQKCLPTLYKTEICAVFTYFCLYLVVLATLFAALKILIAYVYSRTPKTLLFTVKISRFLAQNWNQCNFGWRSLKFGCSGNSFRSLKIYYNILLTRTYCLRKILLSILYRSEICATLACFWLFCCHSNSLCFLKNSASMFEFYNPETLSYTQKLALCYVQKWNLCIFGLFV